MRVPSCAVSYFPSASLQADATNSNLTSHLTVLISTAPTFFQIACFAHAHLNGA